VDAREAARRSSGVLVEIQRLVVRMAGYIHTKQKVPLRAAKAGIPKRRFRQSPEGFQDWQTGGELRSG